MHTFSCSHGLKLLVSVNIFSYLINITLLTQGSSCGLLKSIDFPVILVSLLLNLDSQISFRSSESNSSLVR